jgi:hypothetical protein
VKSHASKEEEGSEEEAGQEEEGREEESREEESREEEEISDCNNALQRNGGGGISRGRHFVSELTTSAARL